MLDLTNKERCNMKELTNSQKIASFITGYNHYEDFSDARNDFYYEECLDPYSQTHCIQSISVLVDDIQPITLEEAEKVRIFCNLDHNCSSDWWHAYEQLGVES